MTPPSGDIASLNGIRAVAVGMVVLSHGGMAWVLPGGLGVTIFFVLSGFLITTLLRREYAATQAVRVGAFYLRRVLRLMPPLFVVVGATALLSSIGVIEGRFTWRGLASVLLYFGNYHVIAFDFAGVPAGIGVVWSLAVEEHFYLLFPPVAILLMHMGRRTVSGITLAALCAAILGWRCWLVAHGVGEHYLTMATDTRADAILVGCLAAFLVEPSVDLRPRAPHGRDYVVGGACLLVLLATIAYRDDDFRLTARYTLQSLAIAPLIILSIRHAAHAPFRWLNARPMVYVGTVSYTIYLSHQVVLYGVMRHAPQLGGAATLAVTALLTLIVAEAVRRMVEQPFVQLRRRLQPRAVPARTPEVPIAMAAR